MVHPNLSDLSEASFAAQQRGEPANEAPKVKDCSFRAMALVGDMTSMSGSVSRSNRSRNVYRYPIVHPHYWNNPRCCPHRSTNLMRARARLRTQVEEHINTRETNFIFG